MSLQPIGQPANTRAKDSSSPRTKPCCRHRPCGQTIPPVAFPEHTSTSLFFREREPDAPIQETVLGGTGPERTSENHRFRLRWMQTAHELKLMLRQQSGPIVFLERLEVRLLPDPESGALVLGRSAPPEVGYRLYQHGYHSWSATMLRTAAESDVFARLRWKHDLDENPETPHQGRFGFLPGASLPAPGAFHSEGLIGLEQTERVEPYRFLAFGGSGGQQFLKFRVVLSPRSARLREFTAIWDFNGRRFAPHGRTGLTPVRWHSQQGKIGGRHPDFGEVLDENVRALSRDMEARVSSAPSPVGWCSWYYYYAKIDESVILTNLRVLRQSSLKLDFFQIDDGWQSAIGDWLTVNGGFKNGMRFLAGEIAEAGYRPGLWFAPFVARPDSKIFREEPEMILRDGRDRPVRALYNPVWGGWTYALDVTHPRTRDYVSEVARTLSLDWGYELLKLDFLYAAAFRGRHHDDTTTGAVRLQQALGWIRKAVPKKTFLLGCGCPLFPAVGLVDGMRIGMDTNHIWSGDLTSRALRDRNYPTLRGALINTITRSAMHRRFWLNDPDCVMVRTTDTKLTPEQILLQASVMALAGGVLLFSDDMTRLDGSSLELLKRTLALHRRCALETPRPLGLLDHHFPRGMFNPAGFLGVWNPTAKPQWVSLTIPLRLVDRNTLRQARDYWTGIRMPWEVYEDRVELALGPFESLVAVLW